MSKCLFLYTQSYPFGKGESFLEAEIEVLSENFNQIYIFPKAVLDDSLRRSLPSNVKLIGLDVSEFNGKQVIKSNLVLFVTILIFELFKEKKLTYLVNTMYRSLLLQIIFRSIKLKEILREFPSSKTGIHYSYWTEDWATALCILKKEGVIDNIVSRVHGYDLFKERRDNMIIPFRYFQLKWLNNITAVSGYSYNYLKSNYSSWKNKFSCFPLGIKDCGESPFISNQQKLTIVSCSNIIPLKRVSHIPEILKRMDVNVRWIHFGDGKERGKLEMNIESLPKNIEVVLKGEVNNKEVLNFYRNNQVDVFLHLSETEGGIPVSIQEAASFGIPVISTDVGGVSEIVNEFHGDLVSKDFKTQDVVLLLQNFLDSKKNTSTYRKKVRKTTLSKFDYKKNHQLFVDQILKLW